MRYSNQKNTSTDINKKSEVFESYDSFTLLELEYKRHLIYNNQFHEQIEVGENSGKSCKTK